MDAKRKEELTRRAKEALRRIAAGGSPMRIPADPCDPDLVISDLLDEAEALAERAEKAEGRADFAEGRMDFRRRCCSDGHADGTPCCNVTEPDEHEDVECQSCLIARLATVETERDTARDDAQEAVADQDLVQALLDVAQADAARMREALGKLLGHGHNLKAFAGTMLRWNEPGVDFSDEARRIVEHANEWHRILVDALSPATDAGKEGNK